MSRIVTLCRIAACAVFLLASATEPAAAATSSTLVNFNSRGDQIVRFDTDGNAVDAHDGQIAQFGDTYYLYGTSYDCGYRWTINSDFCGFKVYSSPDLVHWTDRGHVVQPRSCAHCFRPHILFNPETRKYVLWTNDDSAPDAYRVYTNDSPTGMFTEQDPPRLAERAFFQGDFTLVRDPADGRAYIVHSHNFKFRIEQLTADYLTSSGRHATAEPGFPVEAPAMFERDGTYYITMSSPACGYCTGGPTGYITAPSPLGPWTGTPAWQIERDALQVMGTTGSGLSKAGAGWTDYTFSIDVTPSQTGGEGSPVQAGWLARMSDAGSGYAFLLSDYPYTSPRAPGYLVFLKYPGGERDAVIQPLPFPVDGGRRYHVATTVAGDTLSVAVDGRTVATLTDSTYTAGKVGFAAYSPHAPWGYLAASFDNVKVTGPDGTVLLADDFSAGLDRWNAGTQPVPHLISSNSCGGQPSFVTPLQQRRGGSIYLFGSDLWNGHHNEGPANYFWGRLRFGADGAIEPIECSPSTRVDLARGHRGRQAPTPVADQTSGVEDFSVACTVEDDTALMQTFTAGRTGTLRELRLTAFQQTTPVQRPAGSANVHNIVGSPVDAPLTLRLVTITRHGGIGDVLARREFGADTVGWSARELVMPADVRVARGARYAVIASSTTSQGCYGVAESVADPYPRGYAAVSTDGGQTFTARPARDLKFRTIVSGRR